MSSTDQQAAATTTPPEDEGARNARFDELAIKQRELDAYRNQVRQYETSNTVDGTRWDESQYKIVKNLIPQREQEIQRIRETNKAIYGSENPPHPATTQEIEIYKLQNFPSNINDPQRRQSYDRQDYDTFRYIAAEGRQQGKTIDEIIQQYDSRVNPRPKDNGTSINYEATLAARQAGLNVGSGIVTNLAETYQKDVDRTFGEHNKQINLTEGANPLVNKPAPEPAKTYPMPQNPRRRIGEGDQGNATIPINEQLRRNAEINKIQVQRTVLDDKLPSSSAEFRSGTFSLSGTNNTATIFGIEPEKPKELSDAEFSKLSPREQQNYLDRITQWNQYAEYATRRADQMNKGLKIVNQAEWQKYKGNLLAYLRAEKEAGTKQVTILTHNKITTVPIDQAFLGIVSKAYSANPDDKITGILTPPNIPAGYHVAGVNLTGEGFTEFGSNPVGTLLIAKNETPKAASTEPPSGADWWSGFVGKIGKRANEIATNPNANPLAQTLAAGGQVGAEILEGLIGIGGEISKFKLPDIRKAAGELFNGTGTNGTETNSTEPINPPGTITDRNLNQTDLTAPAQDVTPPTAPGALLTGLSTSVMAAAVTRNPSLLVSGASDAFKQYATIAARQGLLPTVVQTALYVDPLAVAKLVPIRGSKLVIPVGRGIGKAVTTEVESGVIARQLKLGYGEALGRFGVGYANGKFFLGIPKPKNLPLSELVYTKERGGYRITEGPSGAYMTRPETLNELVKLGKMNREEAQLITVQKEASELTGKIKDVPLRTDLTSIEGGQPQASLLAGKETKKMQDLIVSGQSKIKNPTPALKGSIINQYFDLSPRQRRDLDVDLGMTGKSVEKQVLIGKKESKRITAGMNALESPQRTFVDEGGSVKVLTGGKEPQKVIEFVTEKDSLNYGRSFKSNPDIVFNQKVPHNVIQPGGRRTEKMLTYRFQGLRKMSAMLELGGDAEKAIGNFLGTSKGREKEYHDVVEYLLTKASQSKSEKTAIKLKEAAIITERFARKRGVWTDVGLEESPLSNVQPPNILRSIGTGSQKVSRQITPTGKTGLLSQTGEKPENRFASRSTGTKFERSVGSKFERRSVSASQRSIGEKSNSLVRSVGNKSVGSKSTGFERSTGSKSQGSPSRSRSTGGLVSPSKSPSLTSPSKPSPGSPSPSNPLTGKPSPGSPSPVSPGFLKPAPVKVPPVKIPPGLTTTKPNTAQGLLPKKNALAEKIRKKNERTKPDFLGNVPEEQVSGMFNRYETIVGTKRSARQLRKDNALLRKKNNVQTFVRGSNKQFLSSKKSPMLERPKQKKLKAGQIRKWGKNPF